MNNKDMKKAIDAIQPDAYMKTRLEAKIAEAQPKRKPHKRVIRAAAGALCAVVAVTAVSLNGGLHRTKLQNPDNYFVMCVNAAEPYKDKNYTPIDKDKIVLSKPQLSWEEQEGGLVLSQEAEYESDFTVNGKNIEYVKYSCQTGSLISGDINMADYLYKNEKMFDIIVPKEVGDTMHLDMLQGEKIDKMIKDGVFDEYFGGKKPAKGGYYAFWEIFESDNLPYCKEGYGLVSNDTINKVYPYSDDTNLKEYTFQNMMNYTENIAYSGWTPDLSALEWDGKNHFSDIPHDTLTVEITFKDGSKQKTSYELSYTDDGNLVIEKQ